MGSELGKCFGYREVVNITRTIYIDRMKGFAEMVAEAPSEIVAVAIAARRKYGICDKQRQGLAIATTQQEWLFR